MEVKEAVAIAKDYLAELYSSEEITDIGLEEVDFDLETDHWNVTIGFARPWERNAIRALTRNPRDPNEGRSYKVLHIDDATGRVESLKDRFMAPVRQ